MGILKKLQSLSEKDKKRIMFTVLALLGILLFSLYLKFVSKKIAQFQLENFFNQVKIPSLKEELKKADFKIPEINLPKSLEQNIPEVPLPNTLKNYDSFKIPGINQ